MQRHTRLWMLLLRRMRTSSSRTKPDIPAAPLASFESFPLSRGSSATSMTVAPVCAGLRSLHLVAGVSARDAAWVTRAWGYGAKATIIHGQGRSRSHDIKKMSAMVEGWYRRTLGPHSRRAFSSECSCPIAFSLTSTEYDPLLSDK